MSDDLKKLLKAGGTEDIGRLLARRVVNEGLVPSEKKDRARWSKDLLQRLIDAGLPVLGGLRQDAKRILYLSEARFDWLFASYPEPTDEKATGGLDRALGFFLDDLETFEAIERRASHFIQSHQKNRHTHFQTAPNVVVDQSNKAISGYETGLKTIYRKHDGSGHDAVTDPEWTVTPDGDRLFLLTVSLSQLPSAQDEFSTTGEVEPRTFRRVTEVHVSYHPNSGAMYVTSTRGGYKVRLKTAALFAKEILGLEAKPVVIEAEQLALNLALDPKALPPIEGFEFDDIQVTSVICRHPRLEGGATVTVHDAAGLDAAELAACFGLDWRTAEVLSLSCHIQPAASGGENPSAIQVTLNRDGSTSLKGDVKLDFDLRERLPVAWNLRIAKNE